MELTPEALEQLLTLSRLSVGPDVKNRLGADLQRVLDWARELDELDTEGVEPMVHATDLTQPRREDRATAVLGQGALAGAAKTRDGMVAVPQVIK